MHCHVKFLILHGKEKLFVVNDTFFFIKIPIIQLESDICFLMFHVFDVFCSILFSYCVSDLVVTIPCHTCFRSF